MKTRFFFILALIILIIGACNVKTVKEMSPTDSPILAITKVVEKTAIPTITPTPSGLGYPEGEKVLILDCDLFLEAEWGEDIFQWGIIDQGGEQLFPPIFLPPPLIYDQYFYLFDRPKERLLRYELSASDTIQEPLIITLPPVEKYIYGSSPWGIIAADEHLYISYDLNSIGIFSLDGEEIGDLKLPEPYSYTSMLPGPYDIWVDNQGSLVVRAAGAGALANHLTVYFAKGWEHGAWNEIAKGSILLFPFSWGNYLGGHSGSTIKIYEIDLSRNFLETPIREIKEAHYLQTIYGTDNEGWLYTQFPSQNNTGEHVIRRYSLADNTTEFGVLGTETIVHDLSNVVVTSDGTLYIIEYAQNDININPKVHSCRFPESE